MKNKKNKEDKPMNLYISKDLKIFTNINEAAEAEGLYTSNQKPLDRIKETVELILRVFPMSERTPNTNKIYIDRA